MSDSDKKHCRINKFFREHRLKSGRSAADVAQLAGISETFLERIEACLEAMPMDLIFTLTVALNIPSDEVMYLVYDVFKK